jgi:hypothetical protein
MPNYIIDRITAGWLPPSKTWKIVQYEINKKYLSC